MDVYHNVGDSHDLGSNGTGNDWNSSSVMIPDYEPEITPDDAFVDETGLEAAIARPRLSMNRPRLSVAKPSRPSLPKDPLTDEQGPAKIKSKYLLVAVAASLALLIGIASSIFIQHRVSGKDMKLPPSNTYYSDRKVLLYVPKSYVTNALESIDLSSDNSYATYTVPYNRSGRNITIAIDKIEVEEVDIKEGVTAVRYKHIYQPKSSAYLAATTGSSVNRHYYELECLSTDYFCRVYAEEYTYSADRNRFLNDHRDPHHGESSGSGGSTSPTLFGVCETDDDCFAEGNTCNFVNIIGFNLCTPTGGTCAVDSDICTSDADCCDGKCHNTWNVANFKTCDGCFSSQASVLVAASFPASIDALEEKPMGRLRVGDNVLVAANKFEAVYGFAHKHNAKHVEFIKVFIEDEARPLELTGNHLTHVVGYDKPLPASQLQVGQSLQGVVHHLSGGKNGGPRRIVKIESSERDDGLYAPLTASGNIVVNGLLVSTYVSVSENDAYLSIAGMKIISSHDLMHIWFTPMRFACLGITTNFCINQEPETGFAPWVSTGNMILDFGLSQDWIIQASILLLASLFIGPFYLFEQLFRLMFDPSSWGFYVGIAVCSFASFRCYSNRMERNASKHVDY